MESAPQLVVDPAPGHLFERHRGCLFARFIPRPPGDIEQQIEAEG